MVKTVTVLSPTQVKIELNKSFGAFVNTLAHPSTVMHSLEALKKYPDEAQLRVHPVGTGPFKFTEWQQGKDVKLVKNDSYWQKGWPKVDSVTFYPTPEDSTRVAALKSSQVDAIYPLPSNLLGTVQSDSELAVQRDPGIYQFWLAMNNLPRP